MIRKPKEIEINKSRGLEIDLSIPMAWHGTLL